MSPVRRTLTAIGLPIGLILLWHLLSVNSTSRFSSMVSLTDEPKIPGRPFNASHHPGRSASISMPTPKGSSVASLLATSVRIFPSSVVSTISPRPHRARTL